MKRAKKLLGCLFIVLLAGFNLAYLLRLPGIFYEREKIRAWESAETIIPVNNAALRPVSDDPDKGGALTRPVKAEFPVIKVVGIVTGNRCLAFIETEDGKAGAYEAGQKVAGCLLHAIDKTFVELKTGTSPEPGSFTESTRSS